MLQAVNSQEDRKNIPGSWCCGAQQLLRTGSSELTWVGHFQVDDLYLPGDSTWNDNETTSVLQTESQVRELGSRL